MPDAPRKPPRFSNQIGKNEADTQRLVNAVVQMAQNNQNMEQRLQEIVTTVQSNDIYTVEQHRSSEATQALEKSVEETIIGNQRLKEAVQKATQSTSAAIEKVKEAMMEKENLLACCTTEGAQDECINEDNDSALEAINDNGQNQKYSGFIQFMMIVVALGISTAFIGIGITYLIQYAHPDQVIQPNVSMIPVENLLIT